MAIIRRIPWTEQPQDAVGVDSGNPLAIGLRGLVNAAQIKVNQVNNAPAVFTNPDLMTRSPNPRGIGQTSGVASDFIYSTYATQLDAAGGNFSLLAFFQIKSVGAARTAATAGNFQPISIGIDASGNVVGKAALANTTVTSDATYSVGDFICAAHVGSTSGFVLYINGIKQSGLGSASTSGFAFGRSDIAIQAPNFSILGAANWARALSDAEAVELTRNPWQLFAPRTQRIWAPAVASGIPTLSAATLINITSTTATPRVTLTF